ncbi:hypothetical protein COCVIDRAFT_111338, partial [Bipolaris victoriae FI3]
WSGTRSAILSPLPLVALFHFPPASQLKGACMCSSRCFLLNKAALRQSRPPRPRRCSSAFFPLCCPSHPSSAYTGCRRPGGPALWPFLLFTRPAPGPCGPPWTPT